jgi:hypothetical protein
MPDKQLPARPNLEQYKKQAKDLAREFRLRTPDALARVQRHHPRFADLSAAGAPGLDSETWEKIPIALTDAQLVIAREHGFESWPRFAAHITTLNLERSVAGLDDPAAAFIRAACVPRDGSHASGTLEEAELILARYPRVARADIYACAILADEEAVRNSLRRDPGARILPAELTIVIRSRTSVSRATCASIARAPMPSSAPHALCSMRVRMQTPDGSR